jgi:hypothetical protein
LVVHFTNRKNAPLLFSTRRGTRPLEAKMKLSSRRKREKPAGSGRDFPEGQNSHSGEPFQRGADLIPRGNGMLLLRIVFHDDREAWYRRCRRIVRKGSDRAFLALYDMYLDRTEGRPGRKGNPLTPHVSNVHHAGWPGCRDAAVTGR